MANTKTKISAIKQILLVMLPVLILIACNTGETIKAGLHRGSYARMQEINWTDVEWTGGFWGEKLELCRNEIVPAVYEGLTLEEKNTSQLHNLLVAAGIKEGKFQGNNWSDGDCYKWIESLALLYGVTKDPKLDSIMDGWINVIKKIQSPDGYISTNMTLQNREPYMQSPNPNWYSGTYHEMYNQGHLLSAACKHYMATGKKNFLFIAQKLADHMTEVFKPGVPELRVVNGNQPQIMGLIDLYRLTGKKQYLETAQLAIDARGTLAYRSDRTQDHVPFREETEAVGHGVFATYLYSGASDIYAETGEKALLNALKCIWENAASKRTYITGAVGSARNTRSARGDEVHEGFGKDYELPNRIAYNETCANIGNAMWNWRLANITGDAGYTDIMEGTLYNSVLSGVSLNGRTFFYSNPLTWYKDEKDNTGPNPGTRRLTVGFCCPTNLVRTVAGIGRWAYSAGTDTLWIHLYGENKLNTILPDGKIIRLTQETLYPWDGKVKIVINKVQKKALSVMLRIPGWVENPSLTVNGQIWNGNIVPGSYLAVNRKWSEGDIIELDLPMEAKVMEANPQVEDCRGKVAVMRGPLVYCAEFPLSENGDSIWNNGFYMPDNPEFKAEKGEGVLKGITILKSSVFTEREKKQYLENLTVKSMEKDTSGWEGILYRKCKSQNLPKPESASLELTLIPYYTWANRGPAFMTVWIPSAK